jgi:hypothetical protein
LVLASSNPDPSSGLVLYGGTNITDTEPSVFQNGFSLHFEQGSWSVRSDLRRGIQQFSELDEAISFILAVHASDSLARGQL